LDSDDLQDLQFQAEMEQYDAIMENAHVIAEKERQRQEKERDLESESMEGIETSGAELGDIEMGGTGASLTDQDVQDDAQDGQDGRDGQDGQGSGLEEVGGRVGSRVGGGVTIQGAGTSPRRTRSGKVVKYI
jgi:hypothetical protein